MRDDGDDRDPGQQSPGQQVPERQHPEKQKPGQGWPERLDPGSLLSMQEVTSALLTPAPTIRSWERRYGVPVGRSAGGHRRYTVADLNALRGMRDDIDRGYSAAEAATRLKAAIHAPPSPLVNVIIEAACAFDPDRIVAVLDAAQQSLGLGSTVDEVLLPAMRDLGRWWQTGRCDIAHERLATQTVRSWLARVPAGLPSLAEYGPIVLSCGPRDHHTIGLEAFDALLRDRGWSCLVLGARVPSASFALATDEAEAVAAVVVSHLSTARRSTLESMSLVQVRKTQLFYAGNAFLTRRSRQGVPGTYLGTGLTLAAEQISAAILHGSQGQDLIA